jgi:hypothetical protein
VGDCALVAGVVEIASVAVEEAKSDPGGWVLSTTFSGERGAVVGNRAVLVDLHRAAVVGNRAVLVIDLHRAGAMRPFVSAAL